MRLTSCSIFSLLALGTQSLLESTPTRVHISLEITQPAAAQSSGGILTPADSQKIAKAMQAAPKFITDGATMVEYPTNDSSECRVLHNGTIEWYCAPGPIPIPGQYGDYPACYDSVFFQFMKDSFAGQTPKISGLGISYMLQGDTQLNDDGSPTFLEPHIMVVTPHQEDLRRFSSVIQNGTFLRSLNGTSLLIVPVVQLS
ncbi:hypothetical protein F5884DRAFT_746324 [Xylogone sp. PMI_703]|nr:hypothetical protein F5884DRAFT_746324 [Xylogone sp. PMI_703]